MTPERMAHLQDKYVETEAFYDVKECLDEIERLDDCVRTVFIATDCCDGCNSDPQGIVDFIRKHVANKMGFNPEKERDS